MSIPDFASIVNPAGRFLTHPFFITLTLRLLFSFVVL